MQKLPSMQRIKGELIDLQGRQLYLFCLSSEKGSTLKEKNLLPMGLEMQESKWQQILSS